jgi:hypothetical protein
MFFDPVLDWQFSCLKGNADVRHKKETVDIDMKGQFVL